MTLFDIGDQVRCTTSFTNLAGVATDPTTVKFKVKSPSAETEYVYGVDAEVVRTATGVFYVDVTFTASGSWSVRWVASGNLVSAIEQKVKVRATAFAAPT